MEGKLNRWNDRKGFGFIKPQRGGRDVFVHISALKRMTRRPIVGDIIIFEVDIDNDGKTRAVNAAIKGVVARQNSRKKKARLRYAGWHNLIEKVIVVGVIAALGVFTYNTMNRRWFSAFMENKMESLADLETEHYTAFRCEGKTYCSDMSSCEEAEFYLRNCPGTKMDGDGDGIPCERQWCGW